MGYRHGATLYWQVRLLFSVDLLNGQLARGVRDLLGTERGISARVPLRKASAPMQLARSSGADGLVQVVRYVDARF
jgi:hypothetical protein